MIAVVLLTTIIAACGPRDDTAAQLFSDLTPIPYPSLEGAVPAVRQQVEESQQHLAEILAHPETRPQVDVVAQSFADLGLVYVLYDFPEAATVCFDNAHTLVPADYRWTYLAGYVRNLQGMLDAAVPLLERSLEQEPNFLPAMLRLGRAYLELGNPEAARPWFERALGHDPDSAAALEGLGKIAVSEQRSEVALDYFHRALTLAPRASSLNYAMAQAYRDIGRLDEARAALESSGAAAVPIPDPLISPLSIIGESAQFYLIQGGEALADENFEGATAAYRRALEKDDKNVVAYQALSYALEKLGDLEGAIANLEAGIEHTRDNDADERAELHRILGGLEALRQHDEAAIQHFGTALELDENQSGVRMKLANALSRVGRFEDALPHFERLIASEPDFEAEILVRRATALINLRRGEEAMADFRRAVELRPDAPRLRLQYSEALDHLGRTREASIQRKLALESGASSDGSGQVEVLMRRATADAKSGRFAEALAASTSALEIAPERADIRFVRATMLAEIGRLDEAVEEFRRVIDAEPRHPTARHAEITALILLERYGEARVLLNEALHLFSRDAGLAHLQARLLATCPDARVRDGRLAAEVARRLVEGVGGLRIGETLALALAASGDSVRAAELLRQLIREADETGNARLATEFRAKMGVLESGSAWSATGPQEILDAARDEMR